MGRPSTLALRTQKSDGNITVVVGGSVVDVAEGVYLNAMRQSRPNIIALS